LTALILHPKPFLVECVKMTDHEEEALEIELLFSRLLGKSFEFIL